MVKMLNNTKTDEVPNNARRNPFARDLTRFGTLIESEN